MLGRRACFLNRCAFTLIELLVVMAIIGVLAGIAIGVGRHAADSGRVARTQTELATLAGALESYRQQYGDYPRTRVAAEMLQALVGRRGANGEIIQGRGLLDLALFITKNSSDPLQNNSAELVDPWGNAYAYDYFSEAGQRGYVLYSWGPDGMAFAPVNLNNQNREAAANLDNIYAAF